MIVPFIFSFLLPVALSLLMTPLVIKFANIIGATDLPGDRKVHSTEMPRIGGLAVFLSVLISILTVLLLFPELMRDLYEDRRITTTFFLCFIALFALGFRDDLKPLSPEVKFGVQVLLAAVIYFAGFKISNITNPLGEGMLNVEIIDFPLTLLWIVGITNAFNLIDGLDGLASGVATIACVSIFTVSAISGQMETAILALIIAGALVGFLRYNFNPAKIFLGDSGSLFIGFSLAMLSMQSTSKLATGFALLFPVLVLVLPITDTIVSMIRRLIGSFLDKTSESKTHSLLHRLHGMFIPDKSHIHHRLLSMGLSHRATVLALYLVSVFFAGGAFLFTQIDSVQTSMTITGILGFVFLACIKKLRYHEISILNNGLMMSFCEKWLLNRTALISVVDILFIMVSYSLSYTMVRMLDPASVAQLDFGKILIVVLTMKLITLWLTGLYREKVNQFGIGNVLHIGKSVAYSVGITAFVFSVMNVFTFIEAVQFLILDFYFLLTLILGFRMIYQALNFWFNRNKRSGENILIYGAGENGTMILHKIINSPDNNIKVLGFLDDDVRLEGKLVHGYPVFGGHWKLGKTHLKNQIGSIVICDENIKTENLKRLMDKAAKEGIAVKKLNVSFQQIETPKEKEISRQIISGITSDSFQETPVL